MSRHYNTDKRKHSKIVETQLAQQIEAANDQSDNNNLKEKATLILPSAIVIKNLHDLSQEWSTLTVATFYGESESSASPNTQYKEWVIEIEQLDERLIPFIHVEVLWRVGSGQIDDGATIHTPSKAIFFAVEDIQGLTYIKKVTIHVSVYFSDTDVTSNYQAKLLFKIYPPQKDL